MSDHAGSKVYPVSPFSMSLFIARFAVAKQAELLRWLGRIAGLTFLARSLRCMS